MPVPFYNNSGEVIPPYAVMEVEDGFDATSRVIVKVRKPTGDDNEAGYLLNGPVEIPIAKTGTGFTAHEPSWAYYDTGESPSNGEDWGPEDDEWFLSTDGTGFRIIGGADSAAERVLVRVVGGVADVKVIGPCVSYTPDGADPDTDFSTVYPSSCEGPDVYGVNFRNLTAGTTSIIRMELESTGPLVLSSDNFTLTCRSSSLSVYLKATFTSNSLQGVVCNVHKASDDSVVQGYTNMLHSWDPMAGGNLQCAPDNTACDCGTLPFQICFAVPTR